MDSLEQLFRFIVDNKNKDLIIYGNLGRYPDTIVRYLKEFFPSTYIVLHSKYFDLKKELKDFDDTIYLNSPVLGCDMFVCLEPPIHSRPFRYNVHTVVFCSHLMFDKPPPDNVRIVSFWSYADVEREIRKSRELFGQLQNVAVHQRHSKYIKNGVDFFRTKSISCCNNNNNNRDDYSMSDDVNFEEETYVVVNLIPCKTFLEAFLHLLKICDVLRRNLHLIRGWHVCHDNLSGFLKTVRKLNSLSLDNGSNYFLNRTFLKE
jgi:hypothetical protein